MNKIYNFFNSFLYLRGVRRGFGKAGILCLVVFIVSLAAEAQVTVGPATYATLYDAIATEGSNNTFVLIGNVTENDAVIIDDDCTIDLAGFTLTIDVSGTTGATALNVAGYDVTVTFTGGGTFNAIGDGLNYGYGIFCNGGSTKKIILNNTTLIADGTFGMYCDSENLTIEGNGNMTLQATAGSNGMGMYLPLAIAQTLTIDGIPNFNITGDGAGYGFGGLGGDKTINLDNNTTVTVTGESGLRIDTDNLTIQGNGNLTLQATAGSDGHGMIWNSPNAGELTVDGITNLDISGDGTGSSIDCYGGGDKTFTFDNTTVNVEGGFAGLYCVSDNLTIQGSGDLTLQGLTFYGIYWEAGSIGALNINNMNNLKITGDQSGIYCQGSGDKTLILDNATVTAEGGYSGLEFFSDNFTIQGTGNLTLQGITSSNGHGIRWYHSNAGIMTISGNLIPDIINAGWGSGIIIDGIGNTTLNFNLNSAVTITGNLFMMATGSTSTINNSGADVTFLSNSVGNPGIYSPNDIVLNGTGVINATGVAGLAGIELAAGKSVIFTDENQTLNVNNKSTSTVDIPLSMPTTGYVWDITGDGAYGSGEDETTLSPTWTLAAGDVTEQTVTIRLIALPDITTGAGALSSGTVGTAYSTTLAATNSPTSWAVTTGALPGGLTLNNSGVISGTPTTAGTFNFTVTANNGGTSAPVAYSITINAATSPNPVINAHITGPTSMTLNPGYKATSTGEFSVTGTSVTVTQTSGDDHITWNKTTKKLDIAEGLPAGVYTVTLRASNNFSSSTLTFTLTVEKPKFFLDFPTTFPGGTITVVTPNANSYLASNGDVVTITVTPDDGYKLDEITIYMSDGAGNAVNSVTIPLTTSGNAYTFVMPSHHITIVATFTPIKVGNEQWTIDNGQLKAYTKDGMLYVSGLPESATLCVYNVMGVLIYQGIASNVETQCIASLPGRGVYIVTDGKKMVKVVN